MARNYASGLVTGVAISLAVALFTPLWRPALYRWGRPLAKGAVKQGLIAYELGRERVAEMGEAVSDLVAEAQVELATEGASQAGQDPAEVRGSG
ncbi:MAG: DUF5132 domain-containing protein [Acetobacteraceae bacterium]|nr:DUF5132 domain-containing protein [Acetobacteraceae bacterium]